MRMKKLDDYSFITKEYKMGDFPGLSELLALKEWNIQKLLQL